MKYPLKKIRLKNFQCFKDSGDIPLHGITIFIGENDSGKSAILRALDLVLNNGPITIDMFHKIHEDTQKNCEIELTFLCSLGSNEILLKQYIVNEEVTIIRSYSLDESNRITTDLQIKAFVFARPELNEIFSLKANQLKEILAEFGLPYNGVNEAKRELTLYVQDHFSELSKKVEWRSVNWGEISRFLPAFEYYNTSAIGNPVQVVTNTLKSVYRSFFYDVNDEGDEILKAELKGLEKEIIDELNEKIQTELKNKIQDKNKRIRNIYGKYSIDFAGGFQITSLLADFGQGLRDINSIGEGSKKRLFLAITEWDKEIRSTNPLKKVIRGYDEPDTSLHYKAQKEMYYTLKSLSEQEGVNVQPILCTHSLSMIDRAPPRIINHVINNDGISHVDYLKGEEDEEIKEFLYNVSSISGIANSSLFFERCFLIVEGETEFNALPRIYNKITKRNIHEDGVVLVNIEGNGSWRSFLKLLNKNKQNATILFLDFDIQDDGRRSLTTHGLKEIGFAGTFLDSNVVFVGNREFEDVFCNESICRYLNQYHPKINRCKWIPNEIEGLRNEGKFSEKIRKLVGGYQYENGIRNRDFKKSEFGLRIGEIVSEEELLNIKAFTELIEKIDKIVG